MASKALELFDQISLQDGPRWWLWYNRPGYPPVELSKCARTERYSREIIPELGRCPVASRTFLLFNRWLRSIGRRRDLRRPPSFSTLRFRFPSRRHRCSNSRRGRIICARKLEGIETQALGSSESLIPAHNLLAKNFIHCLAAWLVRCRRLPTGLKQRTNLKHHVIFSCAFFMFQFNKQNFD